jgi:hypothetical protein
MMLMDRYATPSGPKTTKPSAGLKHSISIKTEPLGDEKIIRPLSSISNKNVNRRIIDLKPKQLNQTITEKVLQKEPVIDVFGMLGVKNHRRLVVKSLSKPAEFRGFLPSNQNLIY